MRHHIYHIMAEDTFVPYPDYDDADADFYQTIYRKKEFYKTKAKALPTGRKRNRIITKRIV